MSGGLRGVEIQLFPGAGFGENAYLVWDPIGKGGVVVDPGAGTPALLAAALPLGVRVEAILLTHAHIDHVEGVAAAREATGAPIHLHPDALPQYRAVPLQAASFGMEIPPLPSPDHPLSTGTSLRVGPLRFEVLDAPGHAPGHVIFHLPEHRIAFVGDVIFAGSIGRTDLPGGDYRTLMNSIRRSVLTLGDQTRLLPGHGPETTVGHERRFNPFLSSITGGELA